MIFDSPPSHIGVALRAYYPDQNREVYSIPSPQYWSGL
jgi:hypothetical protein